MTIKYDWSRVPSEITWIATDDDGVSHGFNEEPIVGDNGLWCLPSMDYEKYFNLTGENFDLFDKSNYQQSLEKRP